MTIAPGPNATPRRRPVPGDDDAVHRLAVTNGQSRVIGPIPSVYNDGNGLVQLTYSAVTSVTVEAL